jgi:hypothetical protein
MDLAFFESLSRCGRGFGTRAWDRTKRAGREGRVHGFGQSTEDKVDGLEQQNKARSYKEKLLHLHTQLLHSHMSA